MLRTSDLNKYEQLRKIYQSCGLENIGRNIDNAELEKHFKYINAIIPDISLENTDHQSLLKLSFRYLHCPEVWKTLPAEDQIILLSILSACKAYLLHLELSVFVSSSCRFFVSAYLFLDICQMSKY